MNINSTNNALTKLEAETSKSLPVKDNQAKGQVEPASKVDISNLSKLKLEKEGARAKQAQGSENTVKEAVAKIQEYVQKTERTLDFRVDEDTGQTVVSVLDKSSQELIRQIPNELALELAQRLNDEEPFNIFKAQV